MWWKKAGSSRLAQRDTTVPYGKQGTQWSGCSTVLSGPQQRREAAHRSNPPPGSAFGPDQTAPRYKYSPPLVVLLFSDCKGTFAAFPTLYFGADPPRLPGDPATCRYFLQSSTLDRQRLCSTITIPEKHTSLQLLSLGPQRYLFVVAPLVYGYENVCRNEQARCTSGNAIQSAQPAQSVAARSQSHTSTNSGSGAYDPSHSSKEQHTLRGKPSLGTCSEGGSEQLCHVITPCGVNSGSTMITIPALRAVSRENLRWGANSTRKVRQRLVGVWDEDRGLGASCTLPEILAMQ
ncbi:uncharacterized protein B0T23DRAFT_91006 [Neurospora hispaniola]|uniref:Uncharacterized protein n=1 Tax=Neurospora hispaniola TaxID=588809 RepID=A0AAJ0IDL5_9PEZI|nr:hypothetical protein B0T23DRAFT_91006 [Neurospora hispaniola]